MLFKRVSKLTGKENTMDLPITVEQVRSWQEGSLMIQQVFPQLSPDEREFLLSGATRQEWEDAFGVEDEQAGKEE